MLEAIEAMGRRTPVLAAPDVFATDGTSGQAEQTAAAKPSLTVTHGQHNRAASVVEKAEPTKVRLDERLRHDEPTISADELYRKNNVPQLV